MSVKCTKNKREQCSFHVLKELHTWVMEASYSLHASLLVVDKGSPASIQAYKIIISIETFIWLVNATNFKTSIQHLMVWNCAHLPVCDLVFFLSTELHTNGDNSTCISLLIWYQKLCMYQVHSISTNKSPIESSN